MFSKIFGTAGSRIIIAAISLVIALINAKYLGPEGIATIGLIVLGITIILLVNNFIGGTTLVYLIPRENNFILLIVSYCWAILITGVFAMLLQFIRLVPSAYIFDVLLLSLIYSFFSINLYFLLGNQRIREHNIITTFQQIIQLAAVVWFFILQDHSSVRIFVDILYLSFLFTLIFSSILVFRSVKQASLTGVIPLFRRILRLGSLIQVAYSIQMMNYRLSYYIIDFYIGRSGLGIFLFGNQLAEGTWVVGKSISIVQYSGISNSNDADYAKRLTIRLIKLTFLASLSILFVFMLLPEGLFAFFGQSFKGTRYLIALLSVGILANAVSMMFSHYFAGLGKPQYNTIGSAVGFIFTLGLGFLLIPIYGITGAAITASCSYTASLMYQSVIFWRQAKPRVHDFFITAEDFRIIRKEWVHFRQGSKMKQPEPEENLPA